MNQRTVFQHSLVYGSVAGAVLVFFQFMLAYFGQGNNSTLNSLVSLVQVIGIVIAIKHYRDDVLKAGIPFGKAFSVGFFTSVFIGLMGAIYTYILYKYLSPGLMTELVKQMGESMNLSTLSEDEARLFQKLMPRLINPVFVGFAYWMGMVIWGAVLSVFSAFLFRNNNKIQTSQQ